MAKGEKNFKKLIPKEKLAEEEKHSFLGSIPINSHVKVKLNDEDKICRIVSIRQDPKSKKDEPPNEYSYEYYIHYLEYDRRNDHKSN